MRFFSIVLLPLLGFTFANPVPSTESTDLLARDADSDLADRTFFGNCLLASHKKKLCELKGGEWNEHECECKAKPVDKCPNKDWLVSVCTKDQGQFNHDKCCCENAKCPDSTKKEHECGSRGGKWISHECKCQEDRCPNKEHKAATCAQDQGHFNYDKCACENAKCPDSANKEKNCTSKGDKWISHECKCEPKKEEPKGECKDSWKIWICKLKGLKCNYQCNCY